MIAFWLECMGRSVTDENLVKVFETLWRSLDWLNKSLQIPGNSAESRRLDTSCFLCLITPSLLTLITYSSLPVLSTLLLTYYTGLQREISLNDWFPPRTNRVNCSAAREAKLTTVCGREKDSDWSLVTSHWKSEHHCQPLALSRHGILTSAPPRGRFPDISWPSVQVFLTAKTVFILFL